MTGDDDTTGEEVTVSTDDEEDQPAPPHSWRESLMYTHEGDKRAQIAFKILFPVGIWLLSFAVAYGVWSTDRAGAWVGLSIAYLVPPLGKESIIPLGIADGFHPMVMAFTVAFVDLVVAMLLSWNYWILLKIPALGKLLAIVENKGSSAMDRFPSLRRGAWLGIFVFVSIPAVGAGGVTGSIIGRMVGMKPYSVITAVFFGALTSGLLYAYAADLIIQLFVENFQLGLIVLLLVIQAMLVVVLLLRFRNMRKWAAEEGESQV